MLPTSPRHRRLHLSILVATAVLALNAVAVANGWSPFRVPGEAAFMEQTKPSQPQGTSESQLEAHTETLHPVGTGGSRG